MAKSKAADKGKSEKSGGGGGGGGGGKGGGKGKKGDKGGGGGGDSGDDTKSTKPQKGASKIKVRHILVDKHSVMEDLYEQITNGADFDTIARQHSQDKARQGGALGWKQKGTLLPEFEEVAYALGKSTTSKPEMGKIKTSEGYHIIMVEDRG